MHCVCVSHVCGSTCLLVFYPSIHTYVCLWITENTEWWIDLSIWPCSSHLFLGSLWWLTLTDSLTGFRITKEASLWVCLWWSLYIRLIEVARPTFTVDSTLQRLVSWTEEREESRLNISIYLSARLTADTGGQSPQDCAALTSLT